MASSTRQFWNPAYPTGLHEVAIDFRPAVLDKDLNTPPTLGAGDAGSRYIVGGAPTGDWTSQGAKIAEWNGSAWIFETPAEGWAVWVSDEDAIYAFQGLGWIATAGGAASSVTVAQVDALNLQLPADDLQDSLETMLDLLAGVVQPVSWRVQPRGNSTSWDAIGTAAPSISANNTAAGPLSGEGFFISLVTSNANGNVASWASGATRVRLDFAQPAKRRRWLVWRARVRIASDGGTSARHWCGLFSGTPGASNDPTMHGVGFRFLAGTDTNWQCWTNDNSGGGDLNDSGVAASVSTIYDLAITYDGTTVRFYINGALVHSTTTQLPSTSTYLAEYITLTTLTNAARSIAIGPVCCAHG